MFGWSSAATGKIKLRFTLARVEKANERKIKNTWNSHGGIIPLMHVYAPLESVSPSSSPACRLIILLNRKSKQRLAQLFFSLCVVWENTAMKRHFLHGMGGYHLNRVSLHPWNVIFEARERKIWSTKRNVRVGGGFLSFRIQFNLTLHGRTVKARNNSNECEWKQINVGSG